MRTLNSLGLFNLLLVCLHLYRYLLMYMTYHLWLNQKQITNKKYINFRYHNFDMDNSIVCQQKSKTKHIKERLLSTTNLFTRINSNSSRFRQSKTSKQSVRNHTNIPQTLLNNNKENLNYETYLSKVKSAVKFDEKLLVSKSLNSLRKEHDKMNLAIKKTESQIKIMKKEKLFMNNKTMCFNDKFANLQEQIRQKKKALESIKEKQDQVLMEGKILDNIVIRMKKDELYNKNFGRLREMQLRNKERQVCMNEEGILHWDDNIHKLTEKINGMKDVCIKNSEQRVDKLTQYEERIGTLQEKENFEFEMKERTYELMSLESNDIMDAKNVVMREILMTNRLMDKVLENKISRLILKNQKVQNAFHKIKTQTSISDPKALTKKFFSYNELSENLLHSISLFEYKQHEILNENKDLKKKYHEMQNKILEDEKPMRKQNSEHHLKKMKIIEDTNEKELLIKKLKGWIQKKIGLVCPEYKKENDAHNFSCICSELKKQINELGTKDLIEQKYCYGGVRFKKLGKETTEDDEKIRKSEALELNESNIIESQYMIVERQKIKKNQFVIKTHHLSHSKS